MVQMMQNSPRIFLFILLIMELSSLGQKTVKFILFWVEFCEFRLIPAFSPPLVTNNFYCVEICGFHLKIDLKETINTSWYVIIGMNENTTGVIISYVLK